MLLVAVSLPPAAALVWVGRRLLYQDRSLVAQRDLLRRQAAAPAVVRALEQNLANLEHAFDGPVAPHDTVRIVATAQTIVVDPPERAAWLPVPPPRPHADDRSFAAAEARESRDPAGALELYRQASQSAESTVRAGGLLRLARAHLIARRWDEALQAYRLMERLRDLDILGAPADLQARRWTVDVLKNAGRHDEYLRAIADLERDFVAGRWTVDHVTWEVVSDWCKEQTGHLPLIQPERRLVADVAEALWSERATGSARRAARVQRSGPAIATVVTMAQPDRTVALIIPPETTDAWLKTAVKDAPRTGAQAALLAESGPLMSGTESRGLADAVVIPASETGLPWTIALASADTSDLVAELAGRRRLVFIGLTATLLLVAGGTYFVWHVLRRELAVSRLQTEFVAAVSHEFRTPLTSLRHVTELLDEHDDVPVERRRQFYGTLARNTDRLQRLVESLLDFSRMESGRQPYDFRRVDASDLVREVLDDFRAHREVTAPSVTVDAAADGRCPIQADVASLSTAIWNLLDNAVKYSPNGGTVLVRTERRPGHVAIAVSDQGIGIPLRERRDIFDRFVRGAGVASLGIKGTGLGLALVSHIVRGHGGTIELESQVAAGSTFTIVLPSASDTAAEPLTHETPVAARRSS